MSTTLSDLGNNPSEKTGGYLADWNSYSSLRKNKPGETSSFIR
ncbi:Amidase (fragment) [Sphingobacterium multivorum]|uniref:Amidase n=1 Tax=Sphingobacterium multivorum TaxID=28454 RepID=A0A654A6P5_SPHMU